MVKSTPILAAVAVLAGHAAAQPVPAAAPGNNGISGAVFTTVYAPTGYAPNPAMGHGNNLHLYRPDKCPAIGTMPLGFDAPDPRTVCYNGGTDKTGQVWLSGKLIWRARYYTHMHAVECCIHFTVMHVLCLRA